MTHDNKNLPPQTTHPAGEQNAPTTAPALQNPETLTTLSTQLSKTMDRPQGEQAVLASQTQILDRLFTEIVNERVKSGMERYGYLSNSTGEWLHFALRIQKQCVETVKAKGAIN